MRSESQQLELNGYTHQVNCSRKAGYIMMQKVLAPNFFPTSSFHAVRGTGGQPVRSESKQPIAATTSIDHSGSLSVVSMQPSLAIRPPLQDCHWRSVILYHYEFVLSSLLWMLPVHEPRDLYLADNCCMLIFPWRQKKQLLGKHLRMPPASSSSAASAPLVTIGGGRLCFRFLGELEGLTKRKYNETCSTSMTPSSPDSVKCGYLLARLKCKAGQFCRKGGLHSPKTLDQKCVA